MKKLIPLIALVLLSNFVAAQVSKTVNVALAGTLSSLLTSNEKTTITDLTVFGTIDARDIQCMRDELTLLANLDLSGVTITAYTGTGTYSSSNPANQLPDMSFYRMSPEYKKVSLRNVILPPTITTIGMLSFYGCTSLEKIVCMIDTPPVIANMAFYGITPTRIYIPVGKTAVYKAVPDWSSFNFVEISLPTVAGSIIGSSNVCQGQNSVVYTVSPITNATSYIWTLPNGATGASTTNSITVNFNKTSVSGNITVRGSNDAGSGISSTLAITVNSLPGTAGTITGLSSVCAGQNTITYSVPAITNATGYIWTLPTGATGTSSINSITVDFAQTSVSGNITVKGNNSCGDGEPSSLFITIPNSVGTAGPIRGITTICQGQNSVVYTIDPIVNATNYIWTLPTGATGTSSTNNITVNFNRISISGNVSVQGSNNCSIGSTSSLPITVNLLPVTAGTISGNTTVCQGENSVTYSVPAIDNTTSYTWVLPAGATGSSTTNSITVNYTRSAVSGSISVKGHNNCGDGIASYSTVTVNPLPVIELRDTAVISGGMVPLFPTITYTGKGNLSYKWTPSTGLSSDIIAQPFATVTGKTLYTLVVTTPTGCSDSAHVTVSILPMAPPQIGIVGVTGSNKNRIVWNKPVTTGIASYYIYKETTTSNEFEKIGTVPYDSLSVFVDTQSLPDVKSNKYKLSIFDRNGMESALSDAHKTMHLSINKGQNATWNLIWEPYEGFSVSTYNIYKGTNATNLNFLDATSGSSTQYSDLAASAGDVYYQLEVISSTFINPTKVPASIQKSNDSEKVEGSVFVSYNSSRSNIASNFINGINELTGEMNLINIFPNPVKDYLRIDFAGGSTFEILNLTGQVMYNGDLTKNTIVQTSSLSPGVYLIKFKTGRTFEYRKIIKE
jgi:hypothetical protein